MAEVCASCGAALAGEGRFCSSCGAPVAAAATPEARKVVTALFSDVVGSTSLGERLDPEDFKLIVGQAVTRMAEAVSEFGGDVSEYAGDGLLALFGAPVAHEDDPERAVLAGLRIVESVAELAAEVESEWGIAGLAVRVGIETGLAVLGPVGGGGKVEYGAVGDALNTAARLQAASDAGMVLVGAQTQRSIEALFEWGEPRQLNLKGKADPVVAYPVASVRSGPASGAMTTGAIVGRESELAIASEVVNRALDGSGGILIITGDAGIGKSRLVTELRARFEAGEPATGRPRWLEGRCVSYGDSLPYWPFRLPLRACAEHAPADHQPFLDAVQGVTEPAAIAAGSLEETPRRIQEAVAATLAAVARDGPVALAIDDLHWSDASSLALISALFDLADTQPFLLVLTSRLERGQPFWRLREDALRELPHRAREIALAALSEESDRGLLRALVGDAGLPQELERRLLARAEGNPFYLEELVRSLVDAGALVRANGGWRFDREVPVDLPETIEKVVLARIDRLSPAAHELLGIASVLGRQFPVALLDSVAGETGFSRDAMRELQRADLVRDGGRAPAPMLAFKHTLIAEAAYRSLLKRRRQEMHALAVEAIEDIYGERVDEFLGMLAHHTSAAGDATRALDYHRRAGDAAARVHATDEAIEHYTGVLDAAGQLGLAPAEARVREATFARAEQRFSAADLEGCRADYEAAMAGAREAGDAEMEIDVALQLVGFWRTRDFTRASELMEEAVRASEQVAPVARVNALARLAIQYVNQLRLDRAAEIGERALALAEAEADQRSEMRAKDALKLIAQQTGDLDRLDRLTTELLEYLRGAAEDDYYLPWVVLESAFVPLARGEWEPALARINEALELTRAQGARLQEPMFLDALCWAYRSKGDYEQSIENGRAAEAMAHEHGALEWTSWVDATLGWALLESGAVDEAIECLERGLSTAERGGVPAQLARCTCLLAWARSLAGDAEGAAPLRRSGRELLGRVGVPPGRTWLFGAHAYLALARAEIAAGQPSDAEGLVAPLVAAAEASGWAEPLAGGSLVAGLARAAAGDAGRAEVALRRAVEVAESAGLPAPAAEASAALAGLL